MSQLTVHLSKAFWETTVNEDLEAKLKQAVEAAYETKCVVTISKLTSNKPVILEFSGLVATDFEDIEAMVDAAVDAVGFYYGDKIDRKLVSVSVKCTIQQEIEVVLP